MATQPCGTCKNFDPIIRGKDATRQGRCAVKSVYPAVQQPGQIFPVGALRAAPGQLAKPVIVAKDEVVAACEEYRNNPEASK